MTPVSKFLKSGIKKALIFIRIFILQIRYHFIGIEIVNEFLLQSSIGVKEVLSRFGANIGEKCIIHGPIIIHNAFNDYSNLVIGRKTHIGRNVTLDLSEGIVIGEECVISMNCVLLTHSDVGDRPLQKHYPRQVETLSIGSGSYLGANVVVLAGCHIGAGSIVGACGLVNKPIPDKVTAVGVPARVINEFDG